jgi:diacylglycerol kinase family enzyme
MPIDVGVAEHDGGTHRFLSHAVARRTWLRGPAVVVANAQFLGSWDIAPRSHPNDGWLDTTEVSATMSFAQRLEARKRLPTAGHLPHPDLATSRVRERSWVFSRPLDLWLDGTKVGRTRRLSVRVLPDALTVCI